MVRPSRPSMQTVSNWQQRRFGLFIHWGIYSMLGGVWQGQRVDDYNEQIQAHARISGDEYSALAADFNPVLWNPDEIARLAKDAGMKFVVLTAKHHDGFCLFGTKQTSFNVVDATPYGKDIVLGLADACRKEGLEFGVYFSTIDWNFPGATPIDYEPVSGVRNDNEIPDVHAQFNAEQLTELLSLYGPISEVWFDMGKPKLDQSILFADTVHKIQPETMVSGRVFNYQGDFVVMGDNQIPNYPMEEAWQSPASIFHETWGYRSWQRRENLEGKTREHIENLIRVASRGGNYLLNIGPRGDGSVVEFEAELLRNMGSWLSENGEAIYGTEAQPFRELEFGSATVRNSTLFLFVLRAPLSGVLELPDLETEIVSAATMQGETLEFSNAHQAKGIFFSITHTEQRIPVIRVELASKPVIRLRGINAGAGGSYQLNLEDAYTFYHRNGFGYSDPPKLYKLVWILEDVRAGKYKILLDPSDNKRNIKFEDQERNVVSEFTLESRVRSIELELEAAAQIKLSLTSPSELPKESKSYLTFGAASLNFIGTGQ